MTDYGITDNGFVLKRLSVILAEMDEAMRTVFGDNLNLDPASPDGQVNGIMSEAYADLWELLQEAYNSFNPSVATGATLSNLVQLNAIIRKEARPSTVTLSLTGTNGTSIAAGSLVSTDDGIQFATDALVVIAAGVATVDATAVETGPLAVAINTVTNIDTPISGWDTVTNPAVAVLGVDEESDEALRTRRERSIEAASTSVLESILAGVLEIPEVVSARIFENITAIVDAYGLDPHSFMVVADDGAAAMDEAIAEAIFNKKPAGIGTNGAIEISVSDIYGGAHSIKFSRPTAVPIYIKVTLSPNAATYAGDAAVKQAIVDYCESVFGISDDVVYSNMYSPLTDGTLGIDEVTAILTGIVSPPAGTSTIAIDFDEKASFDVANITIVQV